MHLITPIQRLFRQLQTTIHSLSDEQYCIPSSFLTGATIGQHIRHIIELFLELNTGYKTGVVNYDNRKRDRRIETDRLFAVQQLDALSAAISKPDKKLVLKAAYDPATNDFAEVESNYMRELIYNLEHTVHHMALIRVGVKEVSSLHLSEDFGIAASTLKFRQACAQ
ncbi:MAG: hypothetical protein ACTHLE_01265 [Agriterribacter sp.]